MEAYKALGQPRVRHRVPCTRSPTVQPLRWLLLAILPNCDQPESPDPWSSAVPLRFCRHRQCLGRGAAPVPSPSCVTALRLVGQELPWVQHFLQTQLRCCRAQTHSARLRRAESNQQDPLPRAGPWALPRPGKGRAPELNRCQHGRSGSAHGARRVWACPLWDRPGKENPCQMELSCARQVGDHSQDLRQGV